MTPQSQIDIDNLAATWIELRHTKEGSAEQEALFWAHNVFSKLCREQPELAWKAIVTVLSKGANPRVVGDLAAGPLEDLLVYHGRAVIARVEELARRDQTVAAMLGGVWKNDIDDDVWKRVEAVRSHVW